MSSAASSDEISEKGQSKLVDDMLLNEKAKLHAILTKEKLHLAEVVSRKFVLHPCRMFSIAWAIVLAISLFVFASGWFEVQQSTAFDWYVPTSEDSINQDALADARSKLDPISGENETVISTRTEGIPLASMQIIFEWSDPDRFEDVITRENVQRMCEFQRVITDTSGYRKICRVLDSDSGSNAQGENSTCVQGTSSLDAVQWFYPGEAARECKLLDQQSFEVTKTLMFGGFPNFFWEKRFLALQGTDVPAFPIKIRSMLEAAGPLGADSTPDGKTYSALPKDLLSNDDPQMQVYASFYADIEPTVWAYLGMEESFFRSAYADGAKSLGGGLQVRFAADPIQEAEFERLVASDSIMVGGAVFFVGFVMYLHTRSMFVTSTGMILILFSLPVALFMYNAFFRIFYFGDIHIVAIFVTLGIGANDVFVFFDAFRHSEGMWTSLRGINSKSEALERNLYGTGDVETEVLIARVSYTFMRATAAVFNTSFTTFAAFMATGVSPVVPIAAFGFFAALAIMVNFFFTMTFFPSMAVLMHKYFSKPCCKKTTDNTEESENKVDGEAIEGHKENFEDKIFSRLYVPLMLKEVNIGGRSIFLVPIIAIMGLLCVSFVNVSNTTQLETPKNIESSFAESHMFSGIREVFAFDFIGGADYVTVPLTFGIEGIDRGSFSRFDPNGFRGDVVFDTEFDLSTFEAQNYLLDVCTQLEQVSCIPPGQTRPYEGCFESDFLILNVTCTIDLFHNWHSDKFPNETAAIELGEEDPELWLRRLIQFRSENDEFSQDIGIIDGQLKFFVMNYQASIKQFSPEALKTPVFDLLNDVIDSLIDEAPNSLKSITQSSFDMTWIHSERGIVSGMFQGLLISFLVAYLVLLYATRNLALAFFAICAIGSICSGVLGTAYLLGWALGVSEAIAAVMVVGLSVDFTTHTGSMYMHAASEGIATRQGRFEFSALYMGPTVLAGAVTTGGSTAVMFLCQLNAFNKIATLISLTMFLSIVYTFFFFLALCLLLGPQNKDGDLALILRRLFCKSKQDNEQAKQNTLSN